MLKYSLSHVKTDVCPPEFSNKRAVFAHTDIRATIFDTHVRIIRNEQFRKPKSLIINPIGITEHFLWTEASETNSNHHLINNTNFFPWKTWSLLN